MGGLDEEVHAKVAKKRLDSFGNCSHSCQYLPHLPIAPIVLLILKFEESLRKHNTLMLFLELSDVEEVLFAILEK